MLPPSRRIESEGQCLERALARIAQRGWEKGNLEARRGKGSAAERCEQEVAGRKEEERKNEGIGGREGEGEKGKEREKEREGEGERRRGGGGGSGCRNCRRHLQPELAQHCCRSSCAVAVAVAAVYFPQWLPAPFLAAPILVI